MTPSPSLAPPALVPLALALLVAPAPWAMTPEPLGHPGVGAVAPRAPIPAPAPDAGSPSDPDPDPDPDRDANGEPDWDPDGDLHARVHAVNDGDLRFLAPDGADQAHLHRNRIRIGAPSLGTGWVELVQCHERLDPVPATEILFGPRRIRNLRVLQADGVGRAWVEGHGVQLEDVGPGARVCIAAQSRALDSLGGGRYRLRTGPYMRRFLDGYYPIGVRLEIDYPSDILVFDGASPAVQPGFAVRALPGRVEVEAVFEGRLFTCVDFRLTGTQAGAESAPRGACVDPPAPAPRPGPAPTLRPGPAP